MNTHQLSEAELQEQIQKNLKKLDADFDQDYTAKLLDNVLGLLQEEYFRSMFIGFEPLPERKDPDKPVIYVSNHSGMSFPWDAMIFLTGLYKLNGHKFERIARPLVAPMLARTKILSPFLLEGLWRRVGCLEANMLNFESLMNQSAYDVMIYPEGARGIGKGFEHKYELQHMSTSFVRMAIKYQTDVIPFSTVNGEYINPRTYTSSKIDELAQKLGIPFVPLGGTMPWMLLQPWLLYNAFPSKLTYVMGKRVKPYEMTDKPYEEMTQEDFERIRDVIFEQMQAELLAAVEKYGEKPYDMEEFAKNSWKHRDKFPYLAPSGWPVLFKEFDRQYREDSTKKFELAKGFMGFWETARKHPEALAYYIPILGWIPIIIQSMVNTNDPDKHGAP